MGKALIGELSHSVTGRVGYLLLNGMLIFSEAKLQAGDDSTVKGYTDIPLHSEMNVPETESWDDGNYC